MYNEEFRVTPFRAIVYVVAFAGWVQPICSWLIVADDNEADTAVGACKGGGACVVVTAKSNVARDPCANDISISSTAKSYAVDGSS